MDLEKIVKSIPIETRIKTVLIMDDYVNWKNGKYLGNRHKLMPLIMREINKWIEDGMPGIKSNINNKIK